MTKEERYIKLYLQHMLKLVNYVEVRSDYSFSQLKKLHLQILKDIESNYNGLTRDKLRKLNKLLENQIREAFTNEIMPSLNDAFNEVISNEIVYISEGILIATGTKANMLNSPVVANKALRKPYQGKRFETWFKAQTELNIKTVENILRQAYVGGKTKQEVLKQFAENNVKATNNIKTLSRSYLMHASTEAQETMYAENDDVVESYFWLSTLDNRTTMHICGVRDGKEYDKDFKPVGHKLSWDAGPGRIHFNCRSTRLAKIKGMGDILKYMERAAVSAGENYEKGDNKTARGKVRKPLKREREKGIFKIEKLPSGTTFENFLRLQPLDYVYDIIKNKKQAQLFLNGELSLLQIAKSKKSYIH